MPEKWSGVVGNMGVLDLTWAKTEEDLAGITGIEHVGVVRVPENLYTFVCSIPMRGVGVIERESAGRKMELTGETRIDGEFLANGDEETSLVVIGQLFVTPPLERIGFKDLKVTGQLFLPRGSEKALNTKLRQLTGRIIYYNAEGGMPRFFMDQETITREFLEFLPAKTALVVAGTVTVDEDVTVDLVREKVSEITLSGKLIAPKALVPLLQVLTVEKMGAIIDRATWAEHRGRNVHVEADVPDVHVEHGPRPRPEDEGTNPWGEER